MPCSRRPTAGRSSPSSHPWPPPASSACSGSSPRVACDRRCDCSEPRPSPPSACSLAASLLLSSAPARGPQFAPVARPIVGTALATGNADDLLVDVSAAPNRPGPELRDGERPRHPAPAAGTGAPRDDDVLARRPQREVPATRLDAGRWQVAGTAAVGIRPLAHRGRGRAQGHATATYATAWTVASPPLAPGTHRPRYSQRPLGPIMSILAIVLAALLGIALPLALPCAPRNPAAADGLMRRLSSWRSRAPRCFLPRRWQRCR